MNSGRFLLAFVFVLLTCLLLYVISTLISVVPTRTSIDPPDVNKVPVRVYGVTEPAERSIYITPPHEKRVENILVNVGDKIQKDQPLLILDSVEEKSRVEIAKAEVEQRKAQLALSEDKLKRNEPLFNQQVINEFDFVQSKLDVDVQKALLKVAEKNLQEVQSRLDQLTLKSPIDGKVYRMDVHLGETFRPGDKTFIIGKDKLWVNLRIDSFWVNRIHQGKFKIYHADTNQYLGEASFVRSGLFMGPPNFYIQDPTVVTDIKYLEVFAAFEPNQQNIPIELVVYADKMND